MEGQLFDSSAPTPRDLRFRDFAQLGDRIYPTPFLGLHQGSDVLIYRNADAARGISRAQHRLFSALRDQGNHVDSPGTTTVLVCTGLHGVNYDRQIAIYNHMKDDEKLRLAGEQEIERFIADWFFARSGR